MAAAPAQAAAEASPHCVVCFDESEAERVTRCPRGHVVCDGCLLQYVEALPEFRLQAHGFRVPCFERACGTFSVGALAGAYVRAGEPKLLERFLERCCALPAEERSAEAAGLDAQRSRVEVLAQQLFLAISLRCPSCDNVVDPSPDGCRAIECAVCGAYFCWLCFRLELTSSPQ